MERSYRECAEHYDFLISPCRPRTPRHKGKVEQSGVHYVKRNALAGREFRDEVAANDHLLRWCLEEAGLRDHGTTHWKPQLQFEAVERAALRPLPVTRYEIAVWKKAKLHPDCHVVFDCAYYSAPHRLIGQELFLKATPRRVEIFHAFERVASHPRATARGMRQTVPEHLPPAKLQGLLAAPSLVRQKAASVGPAAVELVERLLGERPLDRLRAAQGIPKLGDRFGPARLEAACQRALAYEEVSYGAIKRILAKDLDSEAPDVADRAPIPRTAVYARPASEILTQGVTPWN